MDTHRIAARMGSALPSLVRWGLSPDADLVYRTLVSLDTAREGQLAHELGMAHERIREAVRQLASAGAIRRVSTTSRRTPKATGRAVWAARQPNQVVRQLHVHGARPTGTPTPKPPSLSASPSTSRSGSRPAHQPPAQVPAQVAAHVPAQVAAHVPAHVPARAGTAAAPTEPAPAAPGTTMDAATPGTPSPEPAADNADCPMQTRRWIPRQVPCQPVDTSPAPQPEDEDEPAAPVPSIVLTPRERAIVDLLAQGHTDETAARELDLSRRTVGYALGGLMSRLGVDNRFQLGLALGAMRAATPPRRDA